MAAGEIVVLNYTYNIHCFGPSAHADAFELQVDALPVALVVEENLGDDPQVPPDSAWNKSTRTSRTSRPGTTLTSRRSATL